MTSKGPSRCQVLAVWPGGSTRYEPEEQVLLRIGRAGSMDLRVADPTVSRFHAELCVTADGWWLRPQETRAGTWLGDRELPAGENHQLGFSASVRIGNTQLFCTVPQQQAFDVHRQLDELLRSCHSDNGNVVVQGPPGSGKSWLVHQLLCRLQRADDSVHHVDCTRLTHLAPDQLHAALSPAGAPDDTHRSPCTPRGHENALAPLRIIILDQVDSLPLSLQERLAQTIRQPSSCTPSCNATTTSSGSSKAPCPFGSQDALMFQRWIATSSRCLERACKEETFSVELLEALNEKVVRLPRLHQTPQRIPDLARHFASRAAASQGRPSPRIDAAAVHALCSYHWPGNIRELKTTIDCAVSLAPAHRLTLSALPAVIQQPYSNGSPASPRLHAAVQDLEKKSIIAALASHNGNQTKAAKSLGISRRTLINRMIQFDLPRPRKGE